MVLKKSPCMFFFADALQWETMSSDTQEKVQTGATRDETWKIFFQSCYYKFDVKTYSNKILLSVPFQSATSLVDVVFRHQGIFDAGMQGS